MCMCVCVYIYLSIYLENTMSLKPPLYIHLTSRNIRGLMPLFVGLRNVFVSFSNNLLISF